MPSTQWPRIQRLHKAAMDAAEKAQLAARQGKTRTAEKRFKKAFRDEHQAAQEAVEVGVPEPSRSVLLQSAAFLALKCNDFRNAERLASLGLAGDPPRRIAQELRDLIGTIDFERNLHRKGIKLDGNEVQMTLSGESVGKGVIATDLIADRLDYWGDLVFRTAERKRGMEYREAGRRKHEIRDQFQTYVSAGSPGSYSVTLAVGVSQQAKLPWDTSNKNLVDEILTCWELLSNPEKAAQDEFRAHFEDVRYLRNFVSLTKQIAPDGRHVKQVGVSAIRQGKLHTVSLLPRSRIISPEKPEEEHEVESVEISGILRYASSIRENRIILIDDSDNQHEVDVPEGLMEDIVKKLWDDRVTVQGTKETPDAPIKMKDIEIDDYE